MIENNGKDNINNNDSLIIQQEKNDKQDNRKSNIL